MTLHSKLIIGNKHLSQTESYQIHAFIGTILDHTQIAKVLDR